MPFWLQLLAAGIAALAGGTMGIALIPFLKKQRFCEPIKDTSSDSSSTADTKLIPTMCGILTVFGSLMGLVVGYPLLRQFGTADGTSVAMQTETGILICCLCIALWAAGIGFWADIRIIQRRPLKRTPLFLQAAAVFLVLLAFLYFWEYHFAAFPTTQLDFGFQRINLGIWCMPFMALLGTCSLLCGMHLPESVDGCTITGSGIFSLTAVILLLQQEAYLTALLVLTTAGSCVGVLPWNLHPTKCRLGFGGRFWLCAILTAVAILHRLPTLLLLYNILHAVQLLPALKKEHPTPSSESTLQARLLQQGMQPHQVIAVVAGFSAFCGVMAVFSYR